MNSKELTRIARALADPTRLSLFRAIAEQGELTCGELAERFPIAQSTVSHHLNVLMNAGLIEMRKQGQHHLFRVRAETLRAFCQQMLQMLSTSPPNATLESNTHKEGSL